MKERLKQLGWAVFIVAFLLILPFALVLYAVIDWIIEWLHAIKIKRTTPDRSGSDERSVFHS